jgi:hypothetical protein
MENTVMAEPSSRPMRSVRDGAGTDVIPIRPAAVYGERIPIRDVETILDVAKRWSEDARLVVLSPYADEEDDDGIQAEHPWATEWTGVAVVVHGAAILVPVVGEWPFGADRHADDVDVSTLTAEDLVEALRRMDLHERDPKDVGHRFAEHDASMQRTLDLMIAHAQSDPANAAIIAECDDGEGTLLCEMGMDEHGLPVLFMESASNQHHVEVDHAARLAVSRVEPLCMTAHGMERHLDGVHMTVVLLTPMRSMEFLETLEGQVMDPIGIVRLLSTHADALTRAGIPTFDHTTEHAA